MAKIQMNDVNAMLGSESTAETLNLIRNELGGAYAKAVPIATERNIGEVGIGINSAPEHRNSFLKWNCRSIANRVLRRQPLLSSCLLRLVCSHRRLFL